MTTRGHSWDPLDYTVHGILQARILEMGSLSSGDLPNQGLNPGLLHCKWILYQLSLKGSQEHRSGLQRIFPTQKSNQDLLHCRQILYQLSYRERLVIKSYPILL